MIAVRLLALCLGAAMLITAGCMSVVGPDGERYDVARDAEGFFYVEQPVASTPAQELISQVKGSIYETGEQVSVFGTCLNADDEPFNDTYAYLSAWYPNGSVLFTNVTMQELQEGYYLYTAPMNAVQGTYLTELTCRINGTPNVQAKSFGEWQNPMWVRRINQTQDAVANLSQNITNLSITIGNLQINMTDSFEITWDMIESVNQTVNATYTNLSQQIYNVGVIANASVDRNDSYLAELLHNLTGIVTPVNNTGTVLNHTESYDYPVYWNEWTIEVQVPDPDGSGFITHPDVACTINTTLTATPQDMEPQGNSFEYTEFITSLSTYDWTVVCTYN